jgi:N-acyl amino acid synthase of PEP-CTERM/exosortase system
MGCELTGVRIVDLFDIYFDQFLATTEELKHEAYKLRYQVYCLETGFESEERCQKDIDAFGEQVYYETDEFDPRSAHFLIKHRAKNIYAATTRLILPDPSDIDAPFPIELHCQLERTALRAAERRKSAEVSRFAISKEFKKRAGESGTLAGVSKNLDLYGFPNEHRILPHLSMALVSGLLKMSRDHDIAIWYAVMEPTLLRLLNRYGICFDVIGPAVDYHGARVPCMLVVDEMLESVKRQNFPIWELITRRGRYA